ncbi:hypothetical protein L1049_018259 [Liquidambar formosana]|uniref:non-specific serine/threonine protein kinase n=1 Tax=Liquidambar formosana TaxID=63359 RepID=A0AAP0R9T8_LIQFO
MSRMKHLLRKLHIGGETRSVINPDPSPSTPSPLPLSSSPSSAMGRIGAVDAAAERTAGIAQESAMDFNFLEEEFQVQLALAISASDPDAREDPESVQIKAAKQMSLGCSPSVADRETLVEFLSLRYWNYNAVNYDEKVTDGFYDVYGITSNSITQGKMPLLVDLQALSILDKVDYEVILVNRSVDLELQQLEEKAFLISMECQVSEHDPILGGLIQKIADLVVDRMGGPVDDADEMLKRWTIRSYELRNAQNTIILPLGCLDVGLSRHRALLFKVLADRINLPCMLVKGSYYTGTDEGAVNLIKIDNGSEYIIDLMGAPGTLIPAEVPSSHLPNSGLDGRSCTDVRETPNDSSLVTGKGTGTLEVSSDIDVASKCGSSLSAEVSYMDIQKNWENRKLIGKNEAEKFEHEFGMLLPSLPKSREGSSGTCGKASSAEKMKVKDVSKYVISAAKDPEFAQKLHAVLLESGALPPANLFLDINPLDLGAEKVLDQIHLVKGNNVDDGALCDRDKFLSNLEQSLIPSTSTGVQSLNNVGYDNKQKQSAAVSTEQQNDLKTNILISDLSAHSDTTSEGFVLVGSGANETAQTDTTNFGMVPANPSRMVAGDSNEEQIHESSFPCAASSCQRQLEIALVGDGQQCFQDIGRIFNNIQMDSDSVASLMEPTNSGLRIACNGHSERINSMLGDVAEWEILWEDLQIGERIGIGSYGEVYRAEWNGTEVAVKKFLDQDFSGDALVQFRSEIEIMLRLRHPNAVLFMGAVTRPPNFSILTEFLPRGSLYRLLRRPHHQLDEKRRMRMALDVAKGMNYLHTSHPTIVHRDLKSPNLLVDKNWVVKVCDFGLSRLKHHTFLSSRSTAGTPEWMAPEVLRNEPSNEKCDVYSFGVILWELATSRVPWSGMNPMQVVGAVGFQNRRLEIPPDVDPMAAQIIRDCWQNDSHLRPSFAQLMHRLRRLPRLYVRRPDTTNQTIE